MIVKNYVTNFIFLQNTFNELNIFTNKIFYFLADNYVPTLFCNMIDINPLTYAKSYPIKTINRNYVFFQELFWIIWGNLANFDSLILTNIVNEQKTNFNFSIILNTKYFANEKNILLIDISQYATFNELYEIVLNFISQKHKLSCLLVLGYQAKNLTYRDLYLQLLNTFQKIIKIINFTQIINEDIIDLLLT